jgi:hypothetical protein
MERANVHRKSLHLENAGICVGGGSSIKTHLRDCTDINFINIPSY